MPEQTPQERLAEELSALHGSVLKQPGCRRLAEFLLNRSDVIREMRQQDRREAWAEGYEAGHVSSGLLDNPLRGGQ